MPKEGQKCLTLSKEEMDALERKRRELKLPSRPAVVRHFLDLPQLARKRKGVVRA